MKRVYSGMLFQTVFFLFINISGYAQGIDDKDFKVYIVPHSHADLSWPDTPEVCTNINVKAIGESIDILKTLKDFKFSEEDVFVLKEFIQRYPERKEEVRELFYNNALESGGFYFGPSEVLLGGEGLVRNLYFGKGWLKENFGVDTDFAWNVDEPGHTLQMPQILAKAGINTFIIWKVLLRPGNNLNVSGYVGPPIFNWQAPDGSSVLVTHCPDWYGVGQILRTDSYNDAEKAFKTFSDKQVERYKKWNIPPVILMADGSDCTIPDSRVSINANLWNQKNASPKAKVGSIGDYTKAVKDAVASGKGTLKTLTGEIPCWWDGTQSVLNDAFMLSRKTENNIGIAEKFSTFADIILPGYDYPKEAINSVWQGKLWVHEHNWGGNNGIISDAVKLARSREAYRLSDDVLSTSLDKIDGAVSYKTDGIPIIVFNGLSWKRTDIIDHEIIFDKKGVKEVYLTDNNGKNIPVQLLVKTFHDDKSIKRAKITFEADIPSAGFRTYYLKMGKNISGNGLSVSGSKMENKFYSVKIDSISGGVISIFDKINNKELLNVSKYKGNEIIAMENLGVDEAEEFTNKWWRMSENPVSVKVKENGPVRATLEISGKILNSPVVQEISIYAENPKIDFSTSLNWDGQKRIQINSVFPFDIKHGKAAYEVPFGSVVFGEENPYAQACHPSVRATNNWVDVSDENFGATLATEVTPVDFKDRRDPRFIDARKVKGELPENKFTLDMFPGTFGRIQLQDPVLMNSDFVVQPIMLRSLFSCGDSALYFTQKGIHNYRFAVRSHNGGLKPFDAVKFGMEHNSPLIAYTGAAKSGKLPDAQSFFECLSPSVVITVVKKAEDGAGIILRCYETDGKNTKAVIKSSFGFKKAYMTNIIEENQKEIPVNKNGEIEINVGKNSIETIRFIR